jgi:hypothetical protein
MDWFSGRDRFGYVTPGFSFATTKRSLLYTGDSIGNQGRRNNALFPTASRSSSVSQKFPY